MKYRITDSCLGYAIESRKKWWPFWSSKGEYFTNIHHARQRVAELDKKEL